MNIQETVGKFMQPHAFSVSSDGVLVKYQDDLTFLKNKLKSNGFPQTSVFYFDGKRKFSEIELKAIIVVGECQDSNLVLATLDRLYATSPFTRLVYLDVYPSDPRPLDGFALQWARQNGVEAKPVRVDWKLGKNAAAIRYGKLFAKRSRSRPDTVVAFTNKEITPQVRIAQKARVEVMFA